MFIAYYRVSTQKQGQSGLGLEAQRDAVHAFLGHAPDIEFTEVESGKRDDRPQLQRALNHAELTGATLIVAKLDRLSRDLAFLVTLQKSTVHRIVFADMPEATKEMITMMAFLAQWEREAISKRTKAALAVAKAKGTRLGGDRGNIAQIALSGAQASAEKRSAAARSRAAKVMPYVAEARERGHTSLRQIAAYLNGQRLRTARGNAWTGPAVHALLAGSVQRLIA